jgi:hypothetical protein
VWEDYRADHYAGICDTPEVRARADAAWDRHTWEDCPLRAALGLDSAAAAGDKALLVACWVACYDADLLPDPVATASGEEAQP